MGTAIAKLEVNGATVFVDKKGNIVERPKWLNEKKKNPYANRKSFIVPEMKWRKNATS